MLDFLGSEWALGRRYLWGQENGARRARVAFWGHVKRANTKIEDFLSHENVTLFLSRRYAGILQPPQDPSGAILQLPMAPPRRVTLQVWGRTRGHSHMRNSDFFGFLVIF